jgi:hypothetical protein
MFRSSVMNIRPALPPWCRIINGRDYRIMQKRTLLGVGALIALGVATGSAFTASNNVTGVTATAGYGSVSVSGATVNSVSFTPNSNGDQIASASVVLNGDLSGKTVKVGFGTAADKSCTLTVSGNTTALCSGLAQDIASASTFNISVVS